MHHPPRHPYQAPSTGLLDDLPNAQPRPRHFAGCPALAGPLARAESQAKRLNVALEAINHQQQRGNDTSSGNQRHKPGDQAVITSGANDAAQPQARRNHQRHAHPNDATLRLDPNFIRLHMAQLTRLDNLVVMERFGMLACRFEPIADSLGLDAIGMLDGDDGAAPTDQGNDLGDECLVGAAAMKEGATSRAKGFLTDVATIAPFLLAMDTDIALADLSPCGTDQIGAPYRLRIHGLLLLVRHPGLSMNPSRLLRLLGQTTVQHSLTCTPLSRKNTGLFLRADSVECQQGLTWVIIWHGFGFYTTPRRSVIHGKGLYMSYATNPFVLWLLAHAYGQKGTVALPTARSGDAQLGRFPAGVQDALERLITHYTTWPLPQGSDIEWCFLVGGPGNGKSEALRMLAGALQISLPLRQRGDPAPRTIPVDWPSSAAPVVPGLDIVFINDASIPRPGMGGSGQPGSLFLDIVGGIERLLANETPVVMFGNINRGILVEEQAALRSPSLSSAVSTVSGDFASKLIDWLAEPPPSADTEEDSSTNGVGLQTLVGVEPAKPYYGQLRIPLVSLGAYYNVLIHVVFLDTLSLFEPVPGAGGQAVSFEDEPPSVSPYRPFGGLSDGGALRDQTIAGELLASFVHVQKWEASNCISSSDGTLCEAFPSCPLAQNARWLRNQDLRQRFLDTLRAAEITAARRLTYRDILGYFSLAILGQPRREWLTGTHPCQWVEQKIQALASGTNSKGATVDLLSHRIYANLFPLTRAIPRAYASARALQGDTVYGTVAGMITSTSEAPSGQAFESAFSTIDPAGDVEPWDSIRAKTLDAIESLEIVRPSDEITHWPELPSEAHSEIERALDQALRDEIIQEQTRAGKVSQEASRRVLLLRKWRSIQLLRQVGLALGQIAFRPALVAWLAEQESALRESDPLELGKGIRTLLLPPQSMGQYLLAPFRPRTYNLNDDLPANTILVSVPVNDLRVEIVTRGDILVAEVQLTRAKEKKLPETVASLVVDLAIAREALLHADGSMASFTEIGASAFTRIERARASLIGRSRVKGATVYFTDSVGKLYRVTANPAGPAVLRVVP